MKISDITKLIPKATLIGSGDAWVEHVSTDTRSIQPGSLFFALKGDRFDGHEYAEAAERAGAIAAVVSRRMDIQIPQILTQDTRLALGHAARGWRSRFKIPLIGVAGSNGKTTVTQMLASILKAATGEEGRLATKGNLNNEIGLPLTLFRLQSDHRFAVVEMGMNHPGEIRYLAEIAKPTVALVNNAQREHQEFLGSVEATAIENGAILQALPPEGIAVFPQDDPCAPLWWQLSGSRPIFNFGFIQKALIQANMSETPTGLLLQLKTPRGDLSAQLNLTGAHNAHNAAAAATAALAAGIALKDIQNGLESFRPVPGRGVLLKTEIGATLIDDSYNANPDSVLAAIELLASRNGPAVLILGDMGEVGDQGASFHAEIGLHARKRNLAALLSIGDISRASSQAFGTPGGEHFEQIESLILRAKDLATTDATLLIKGSRFMRMERVIQALESPQTITNPH